MSLMTAASPLPAPTPAPMTPEEFLRLPDGGQGYELVDGELVERTVSAKSSRVGYELGVSIGIHCRAHQSAWIFGPDASFRCFPDHPNSIRRADVAVILADRMTPQEYESSTTISICPDLVVEVISPNDLAVDLVRKRLDWLEAGAKLVWIVDPEDRSVQVYACGARPVICTAEDTLPGEPVLPGFAVPVADLFRLPKVS